jgi:hypothetical protein
VAFSGFIRTQEHHDALLRWCRKVNRLELTDHFGPHLVDPHHPVRPHEKRPSMRVPWKFDYTVKAIMYGLAA